MKLDIVKVCAGLIVILALLMLPGLAADTTWRHSGFTQWGYDINSHGLNVWNGTQNNDNYDYLITKNSTHCLAIDGANGSISADTDFSNLINSILANNKVIQISSGTFTANSKINISQSQVYIHGGGSSTVIQDATGGTSDLFNISGATKVSITGFEFYTTTTKTGGYAINITDCNTVKINNIRVNLNKKGMHGIGIHGASYVIYLDRIIVNNLISTSNGYYISYTGADVYLTNCHTISDTPTDNNGTGLLIEQGSGMYFSGCEYYGSNYGVSINAKYSNIYWVWFDSVITDSTYGQGWYITTTGTYKVFGMMITDSWAGSSQTSSGFQINSANVTATSITNSQSINNSAYGIVLGGSCKNIRLLNCIASGNARGSTAQGLYISGSEISIIGGVYGENYHPDYTPNQSHGIYSTGANVTVTSADLRDNTIGAISSADIIAYDNLGTTSLNYDFYGEAYIYNNAVDTVIETANTPIALRQISSGLVNGWTFDAGSTGAITAYADGTGGTVLVSDAGHGLSNGDIITIRGTTNYNGVFTVSAVTTDNFKITDTWVNDNGASDWDQGASLTAGANSAGTYTIRWQMSSAPDAAMTCNWVIYINAVAQTKTTGERKFTQNDYGCCTSTGILDISAGDVIWLAIQSDGTQNVLNKHGNFNLHKIC